MLPGGDGGITPWTGNTVEAMTGHSSGLELPLGEVVRIITGITLDDKGNIRRYMTTAPHGDGHVEIIYARNITDFREELVIVVVAPPSGRSPAIKGYGPADMLAKLRTYDSMGYDDAIMNVVRQARDYLRDYLNRLL